MAWKNRRGSSRSRHPWASASCGLAPWRTNRNSRSPPSPAAAPCSSWMRSTTSFLRGRCRRTLRPWTRRSNTRGVVMRWILGAILVVAACMATSNAGDAKKRVLLLWQKPDGHPKDTHEYELGQKILKRELEKFAALDPVLVNADDPWKEGPELLAKADGVVLFVSEGARWVNSDPKRL